VAAPRLPGSTCADCSTSASSASTELGPWPDSDRPRRGALSDLKGRRGACHEQARHLPGTHHDRCQRPAAPPNLDTERLKTRTSGLS
jgi:hypothetical protein